MYIRIRQQESFSSFQSYKLSNKTVLYKVYNQVHEILHTRIDI